MVPATSSGFCLCTVAEPAGSGAAAAAFVGPTNTQVIPRSHGGTRKAAATGSPLDTLSGGGLSKAEGAGVGIPLWYAIDGKLGSPVAD